MQKHTKIYLDYFGYDVTDWIGCEIPGCGKQAVDINHIDARGMGGSKEKDTIENLMATCREHHHRFGDHKDVKDWLRGVHYSNMIQHKSDHPFSILQLRNVFTGSWHFLNSVKGSCFREFSKHLRIISDAIKEIESSIGRSTSSGWHGSSPDGTINNT